MTWEELKIGLKELGYISVLWHKDDIISVLEKRMVGIKDAVKYTDEDLDKIVAYIERLFDAQVGINWEILEGYIDAYFEENSIG